MPEQDGSMRRRWRWQHWNGLRRLVAPLELHRVTSTCQTTCHGPARYVECQRPAGKHTACSSKHPGYQVLQILFEHSDAVAEMLHNKQAECAPYMCTCSGVHFGIAVSPNNHQCACAHVHSCLSHATSAAMHPSSAGSLSNDIRAQSTQPHWADQKLGLHVQCSIKEGL